MARILELLDWAFKTMIIHILRALMDKVDSMHEPMGSVSRDGNPKREPKRNARWKKHCNINEECL